MLMWESLLFNMSSIQEFILKFSVFCHSEPCVRNLIIRGFRDPSSLRSVGMTGSRFDLAYIELMLFNFAVFFCTSVLLSFKTLNYCVFDFSPT